MRVERTDGLQMTRAGAVAVWTLDRPARRNAFDGPTLEALARAIDDLQRDEALRAAVLTGSGERAFCAGADLVERRAMSVAEVSDRLERYDAVFGALDACRKPVVAAVNGTAAANREDIGKVSRTQDAMEARLRTLENSQARSDERFSSILTYLSRIDNRLERIEQGRIDNRLERIEQGRQK